MRVRRSIVAALAMGLSPLRLSLAQPAAQAVRIGFLRFSDQRSGAPYVESFRRGLRGLGYVEGKNFVLHARFANGDTALLPTLAAALVELRPNVIVTTDTPSTRAAQHATTVIPIVMANVIDPVGSGFVDSLARPGANITGLTSMTGDVSTKHIEFLAMAVPALARVAVLLNPGNSAHRAVLANIEASAQRHGISALPMPAASRKEIDDAFAAMTAAKANALVVLADAFFTQQWAQIAHEAKTHRLPSISANREYAQAGGLMSYGQDFQDNIRRAAGFVDKILKGARPGDLPIERPTRFELIVNRRTAGALGVSMPQDLLLRADAVID